MIYILILILKFINFIIVRLKILFVKLGTTLHRKPRIKLLFLLKLWKFTILLFLFIIIIFRLNIRLRLNIFIFLLHLKLNCIIVILLISILLFLNIIIVVVVVLTYIRIKFKFKCLVVEIILLHVVNIFHILLISLLIIIWRNNTNNVRFKIKILKILFLLLLWL